MDKFIQSGKIVNTHGIRGEIKVQPWTDSNDFFDTVSHIYINQKPFEILSIRTHKNCLLMKLDGVETIEQAELLKNMVISINREDVKLEKNQYFIADVIGFEVFDNRKQKIIGIIKDVMEFPSSKIYVVKGEKEILIPAIKEFVEKIDFDNKKIYMNTIQGMGDDDEI